jgi:hypothetical protein
MSSHRGWDLYTVGRVSEEREIPSSELSPINSLPQRSSTQQNTTLNLPILPQPCDSHSSPLSSPSQASPPPPPSLAVNTTSPPLPAPSAPSPKSATTSGSSPTSPRARSTARAALKSASSSSTSKLPTGAAWTSCAPLTRISTPLRTTRFTNAEPTRLSISLGRAISMA